MADAAKSPKPDRMECGCRGRQGAMHGSRMSPQQDDPRHANAALDILDERFARGEIDKSEYLEKKQLISSRDPVSKSDADANRARSSPALQKPPSERQR